MPDAITIGIWKKRCRQGKSWIGSSFVDTNAEDWTDWYGWQPLIDVVTDQIMWWRIVLPAPWGWPSVIFRRNKKT